MKRTRIFFTFPAILCLLCITCCCRAQLCQGSLGDPVVNITFGAGSNPGPPVKAATINYTYIPRPCPNDGEYTIVNSTSGCYANTWHTIEHDITGDPDGYFMLVNASYETGDFYLDTVRGLCAGTTYEFAAWVINLMNKPNTILPNISFSIEQTDGLVLQTYNTGDIPVTATPNWNHYGFYFTTPTGLSDVVVRMRNNARGGTGNDVALDNITFRPCGPYIGISFNNPIGENLWQHCYNTDTTYTFYSVVNPASASMAFQWQESTDGTGTWKDIPGANDATLTYHFNAGAPRGRYFFRLTAAGSSTNLSVPSCRVASNTSLVVVNPYDSITTQVPTLCAGDTLELAAGGGNAYAWTGPGNFTASGSPVKVFPATTAYNGTFYLTVSSAANCSIKDSVVVTVKPQPAVEAGKDTSICTGSSIVLQGNTSTGTYNWSPAAGLSDTHIAGPVASPAHTTQYLLAATNAEGCTNSDTVTVNVLTAPVVHAGPDKIITEGQSVQLDGSVSGSSDSYYWTPGSYLSDDHTLQPLASPVTDITYTLHAGSACGQASDSTFVKVYKQVLVPNSFSPNSDGVNDQWRIDALTSYPRAELFVFNRYGQPVFQSKGYNHPWDGTRNGKPLPVDTYYYVIDLHDGRPRLSGWVLLVR